MVMEPKYFAEEVIAHPNHTLIRWLDPYGFKPVFFRVSFRFVLEDDYDVLSTAVRTFP